MLDTVLIATICHDEMSQVKGKNTLRLCGGFPVPQPITSQSPGSAQTKPEGPLWFENSEPVLVKKDLILSGSCCPWRLLSHSHTLMLGVSIQTSGDSMWSDIEGSWRSICLCCSQHGFISSTFQSFFTNLTYFKFSYSEFSLIRDIRVGRNYSLRSFMFHK